MMGSIFKPQSSTAPVGFSGATQYNIPEYFQKVQEELPQHQFNTFQTTNNVAPNYTENPAPTVLEQATNVESPNINSIPSSVTPEKGVESLPQTQSSGFNFDPNGGSLFDQMSTSYGQPATWQQQYQQQNPNANNILRGGSNFTQGFQDYIGQQGYHVQDNSSFDGGMNIVEKLKQDIIKKGDPSNLFTQQQRRI